jgi:hypothetical protein
MLAAEFELDRLFAEVDDGRDDMAWPLAPELDDIFAEIGLDHRDLGSVEMLIEPDLIAHHRLALGDELGTGRLAELEHDGPSIGRSRRVMHLPATHRHLTLIGLEIEVEVR